ncbi:MAG: DivIVA domain-containing protein [Deltaproteobacteria bacterium]|nr:DivIVA domain-containing protein [Deltaproteobacteria bacterium]
MKIEPADIRNRKFKIKFRGFDVKEVDEFLQALAKELEERIRDNKNLQEKMAELSSQLEATPQNDMENYKRHVAEVEDTSASMIKKARVTADEILEDARLELNKIYAEIENTKRLKSQLEKYFESFLEFNSKLLRMWKREVEKGETSKKQ